MSQTDPAVGIRVGAQTELAARNRTCANASSPSRPDRTAWTTVSAALPMTKAPAMPAKATATDDKATATENTATIA
ncbi:hypothetical protein A4H34_01415 [Peptidiphaga gingivicola]|uniref:Uncharacterized protein n=1 Tax=Peptidiphaga gingivicola TaxID=2741497 RepID=A0A179B337_9ACTO|nr:hypothetical protein A4H34_01415 [Peptidiphaga gingivicola]